MTTLGIDIGGTRIKAGRVDPSGRIEASRGVSTPTNLSDLRDALLSLVSDLNGGSPPSAVGFGCKGIINSDTTRVESLPGTVSFLEGHLLRDLIAPALPEGTPVFADNDARAAMAGELAWGAARGYTSALMLTLGTGVGGAVVVGGKLLRGAWGAAGHLGHVTVDPDGSPCICGSHGCIETVFSARAIEAEAFAAAHRGCDTVLTTELGRGTLTCEAVFRAAREGDEIANRIVARATKALGAAIAGLFHAFDPEVMIIGGQIAEAGESLVEALRKETAWRTRRLLRRAIPIVPAQLGDSAGIVGAAALTLGM